MTISLGFYHSFPADPTQKRRMEPPPALDTVADGLRSAAAAATATEASSQTVPGEGLPETPEFMQQAKEQLHQVLESMPAEGKKAYDEAMTRAPHLVDLESNVERFLRFDKFNPKAAAKRIADYWEARLDLFGPERTYLPMMLSGQGAMSEDDVEVLKSGHIMVLPDDMLGRPVVLHDTSRLCTAQLMDPDKRLRCMFYVYSVLSQRDGAQETGYNALTLLSDKTRLSSFNTTMSWKAMTLFSIRKVIPLTMVSSQHVMLSTRPAIKSIVVWTKKAFNKPEVDRPKNLVFHGFKPLDALHVDLRKEGFHLEGLPKVSLGGLFTFGCFRRWIDERIRHEQQLYLQFTGRISADPDVKVAPSQPDNSEEDTLRKRRAVDAAYARRKRARKRIEREVLEGQIQRLSVQRMSLRATNEKLEQLVSDATFVVRQHEGTLERERLQEWSRAVLSADVTRSLLNESAALFPAGNRVAVARLPYAPQARTLALNTGPAENPLLVALLAEHTTAARAARLALPHPAELSHIRQPEILALSTGNPTTSFPAAAQLPPPPSPFPEFGFSSLLGAAVRVPGDVAMALEAFRQRLPAPVPVTHVSEGLWPAPTVLWSSSSSGDNLLSGRGLGPPRTVEVPIRLPPSDSERFLDSLRQRKAPHRPPGGL